MVWEVEGFHWRGVPQGLGFLSHCTSSRLASVRNVRELGALYGLANNILRD